MPDTESFPGFPQGVLEFFRQLSRHNDREWFGEHKAVYTDEVLPAAQSFVRAFGGRLMGLSDGIRYDTRTSGTGSILKIYRDVRFGKDKTPYNPYLRAVFWTGRDRKSEAPAFYFWMDHSGARLYAGIHDFSPALLSRYRDRAADETTGTALERAAAAVRKAGAFELGGQHYKRVPGGFAQDHPRAELLKHNGLYAASPGIPPELTASSGLVDRCLAHAKCMMPLVDWLAALVRP